MDKYIKIQKTINDKKRFIVTPDISTPFILPDTLLHISSVAKKYNGILKLGTNQKISIINLKEEHLENVLKELNFKCVPKGKYLLTNITLCTSNFCKMSKYPTIGIYMKIINEFYQLELPAKTKVSISSCKNSCTSAYVKDIGILVDTNNKLFISIGGCAGLNPQSGYILASNLDEDSLMLIFKNIINFYNSNAFKNERIRTFIDRIGFTLFKENVLL